MRSTALLSLLTVCGLSAGCGLDPAKIAPHALLQDDGGKAVFPGAVRFAVVGNTAGDEMTEDVLASIQASKDGTPPLSFLALAGGLVPSSSNAGWKAMNEAFSDLLAPAGGGSGLPALPAAGDGEGRGDPNYAGMAAAFPGFGADIGLNRVASWYSVDLVSAEVTWRVFVLDAAKSRLGSRWNEELGWLKTASEGDYDGAIVLLYAPTWSLAGPAPTGTIAEAPGELLDTLVAQIDDTKVKAVFYGGDPASQVVAPEGEWGTLHVGAGGGGSALADLWREAPDPPAGEDPLTLEPGFDGTLVAALNAWSSATDMNPKLVDMARGRADFEGAPRRVSAEAVPTWGWWEVTVDGPALDLRLHLYQPDGTLAPSWHGSTKLNEAWKTIP